MSASVPIVVEDGLAARLRANAEALGLVAAFTVALAIRVPTLRQPLLEVHEFRQTQTAYTALLFHEQGIDLLHPRLPVLGPPYEVPFEFPLFQALASLPMDLGVAPDLAMRSMGLICFMLTGLLTWALVRHVAGRGAAFATVLFFLFSPFGFVWSRTSMIEYLATATAVGTVWAAVRWRDDRRWAWWGLALGLGVGASLVKLTTAVFWFLPLVLYRGAADRPGVRGWLRALIDPRFIVLLVVPALIGLAWTVHADAIKDANPATAWLTSAGLGRWNFGTIPQRLDLTTWVRIFQRVEWYQVGAPFLILLAVSAVPAVRSRQRWFWGGMALASILPIAVFFNLYWVHDYYLSAISPAVAAFLGLGAAALWGWARPAWARSALIGLAVVGAVVWGVNSRGYWERTFDAVNDLWRVLPMARELASVSEPDDDVIVAWKDWSPSILYYARRSGLMLPNEIRNEPFLGHLEEQPYRVFYSTDPSKDPLWILRDWPWIGAIGPRAYALGTDPADLRGSGLVASGNDGTWGTVGAGGERLLDGPRTIVCGEGGDELQLAAGDRGTWLHLAVDPTNPAVRDARVSVVADLAPLPMQPVIGVGPDVAPPGSPLTVTCDGAEALTVLDAVDAPFPP